MGDNDLFHIMYTCRSMRRLRPDPVPDELIYKVIEAGTQAPCGSGVQAWRFVVVTEPEIKRQIAEIYQRGWSSAMKQYAEAGVTVGTDKAGRQLAAAVYMAEHMAEVPVLLFACLRARRMHAGRLAGPNAANFLRVSGGSIYPAVQNILLACRALGLGATLTGVTTLYDDEIKAILGLPESVTTYAMIPIGYPQGRFGPVTRLPVEEVTWHNRYGVPFTKPS